MRQAGGENFKGKKSLGLADNRSCWLHFWRLFLSILPFLLKCNDNFCYIYRLLLPAINKKAWHSEIIFAEFPHFQIIMTFIFWDKGSVNAARKIRILKLNNFNDECVSSG